MTYIYKLTLKDGGTYVGQRHCQCEPEKDSKYLGSSKSFKKTDVVKKEILIQGEYSDEQLAWLETIAIMEDKCNSPKNYNITLGALAWGKYSYTKMHSEECKTKMRQKALERWAKPETRSKLEYARKHQMEGNDVKERISKTVRATCNDLNWKLQHSLRIKKALQNARRPNNRYYIMDLLTGTIYSSRLEAAKELGCSKDTIDSILKGNSSKKFPDIQLRKISNEDYYNLHIKGAQNV